MTAKRALPIVLSLSAAWLAPPARLSASEDGGLFGDRLLIGGEVTANFSEEDPGYFNASEYRRNGLRLLRLNLALELLLGDRLAVLTEVRSDNVDAPEPYGLYLRFRPRLDWPFDVQLGRIPPVFGGFARRRYDFDNPLIGYPLAYQYPTLVRADAAPREASELLASRGWGVRLRYPLGDGSIMEGLPLANPLRWDTGVEVRLGGRPADRMELAVALTQGTIANPRVEDDNSGKQWAARAGFRPWFGARIGVSAARGAYLSDEVLEELPPGREGSEGRFHQSALGVDGEVSRGFWLIRGEVIWSRFETPLDGISSLDALGYTIEGRYKVTPGLYLAGRFDRLSFSEIASPNGRVSWDAPVTRVEAGVGYQIRRNVLAKLAVQYNERDAGARTSRVIPAVQLLYWF